MNYDNDIAGHNHQVLFCRIAIKTVMDKARTMSVVKIKKTFVLCKKVELFSMLAVAPAADLRRI